ncbi:MAG TPA: hypothetical protein VGS06_31220 [Streptosporangiaceae bacterium]|nr:hypothetical protein [Streptosporangiaceae bacterium]
MTTPGMPRTRYVLRSRACRIRPLCRMASRATGTAMTVARAAAAPPYRAVCPAASSSETLAPPDRAGGSASAIQYRADPTGTPSASRISAANRASAGQRAQPSRSGRLRRSGPDRLTRPPSLVALSRSTPSPARTSRLSSTSTRDSAHEAARL